MRRVTTSLLGIGLLTSTIGCVTVGDCDCETYPFNQGLSHHTMAMAAVAPPALLPAPATRTPEALPEPMPAK